MEKLISNNNIENKIYEIRGKQVMLDSDLAKLYKCTNGTEDVNKAVKRNIERFPENFYFQLSKEEHYNISRFQNGTLNVSRKRGANLKTIYNNTFHDRYFVLDKNIVYQWDINKQCWF